jgi:hypothetical protein
MKLVVGWIIHRRYIKLSYEVRTVKNNEEAGPNDHEWMRRDEGNQRSSLIKSALTTVLQIFQPN